MKWIGASRLEMLYHGNTFYRTENSFPGLLHLTNDWEVKRPAGEFIPRINPGFVAEGDFLYGVQRLIGCARKRK